MATNPVAQVAGAVASGPLAVVSSFVNLGKDLIDKFVPDPQKKLDAQQHLADQAMTLQLAQIDQQNKIMAAASANISADEKVSGARAYLCYGVTTAILANIMVVPLLNSVLKAYTKMSIEPVQIPGNVLITFAVIMLGFVGIPQAIDLVRTIMSLPGDSQVKLPLGLGQIGNKS